MTSEFDNAIALIGELDRIFPGTQSLIVGGAVRDIYLGKPVHDVDLATNIPFEDLAKVCELRDITKNTVNPQPVSIIHFNGFPFEIAAFRADSSGVEGRSNNEATLVNSFALDAARRDITINAIGMNSLGGFVDPEGGISDLENGIIRAVGIPAIRFREDATRILRVFRFAARFGFEIEEETLRVAIHNRWRLSDPAQISSESISKELFKTASSGPQLARFIAALTVANIIPAVLPEISDLIGFTHDPIHHPEGESTVLGHIFECLLASTSNDPVVNLAILFHDLGKAVTRGVKENGHSSYHGHEGAGVPIVEGIFRRLRFPDLSANDKVNILFAVKRHMLMHKLSELNRKTQASLVHDPGWEVLKAVGICDAVSRDRQNHVEITKELMSEINSVEARVHAIAKSSDDLRLKVKKYIDGHKVQSWFPITVSRPQLLKPILEGVAEFILDILDEGREPFLSEIIGKAEEILGNEIV
jgi:tRNA nucleotidyltransferase/poly(A) polymerase